MESIALLLKFTLINDKFTLYLHDGNVLSHITLNKSEDNVEYYHSRIIVSLLFKNFNIELSFNKQPFEYDNIHHQKLIFLEYFFKDNCLQRLEPLPLNILHRFVKLRNKDVINIFKYLILLNSKPNDPFSFELIIKEIPDELIEVFKSIEFDKKHDDENMSQNVLNQRSEILDDIISTSSSDDDDIIEDAIYSTPKQYQRKLRRIDSNELSNENRLPPSILLPYPEIHSKRIKEGRLVAMFPTHFENIELLKNTKLHLYFIPDELKHKHETTLPKYEIKPNINCIELILTVKEMQQIFGKIEDSRSLKTIAFDKDSIIDIQLMKSCYKNNLYSAIWKLKKFRVNNKKKKKEIKSRDISSPKSNNVNEFTTANTNLIPLQHSNLRLANSRSVTSQTDPLMQFAGLNLKSGETKYFRIYCLLLACSDESQSFFKLTVTDFTKNKNVEQKYLLDKFLIDYNNKIEDNEGIRIIMYPNVFKPFNEKVSKLYKKDIKDMFIGTSKNLSDKGIICKMTIKANLYANKLNAIVRECEPFTAKEFLLLPDQEKFYLEKLYRNTLSRITHYSQRFVLDYYKICFPFTLNNLRLILSIPKKNEDTTNYNIPRTETTLDYNSDESESESESEEEPMLDENFYSDKENEETDYSIMNTSSADISMTSRLVNFNDLYKLNNITTNDKFIYIVDTEIVNIDCNKLYFEFFLRSKSPDEEFVDPRKIINVIVSSPTKLKAFFNLTEDESKPEKILQSINSRYASDIKKLINQTFTFKLRRIHIKLSNNVKLLTWSLVGCTMEELNSLSRKNSIKIKLEI